ncbi:MULTISPECIES: hypothetical protein [unclassified Pseudomonas]|uniref:hypothetical protein n=1 Tax=unclassified Pseudomonas TaxID=196821 RepID=UPI0010678700|nr:hypothetical protein [Pseudomonas sp. SXM-1]QBQ11852.1 hypothetical protein DCC84_19835 [Pseudomonas sp. SXM-1]
MAISLKKPSGFTSNNHKKTQVVALSEHVEEDATLLIDGTILNCFVSFFPYEIEVGKTYDVDLTINLSDDYEVIRVDTVDCLVEKTGHGYAYFLFGRLCNETFHTFTPLDDQDLHYEHPALNEQLIRLEVERIDVSFH